MPSLSDSFWGRPSEAASGRPSCFCGGGFGRVDVLPADGDLPAVAFRRCEACAHVVFVPVPRVEPGPTTPREVAPC